MEKMKKKGKVFHSKLFDNDEYMMLNSINKIAYGVARWFVCLPINFVNMFIGLFNMIIAFFVGIWKGIKYIGECFSKGNVYVKLSFLFMGLACIRFKKYVKGIIYLALEGAFACFVVLFAAPYLSKFDNLGDVAMGTVIGPDGFEIYGVIDDSFTILLYSILSICVIGLFFVIYLQSVKECYACQKNDEQGVENAPFIKEAKDLLDKQYHKTLLALPLLGIFMFTMLPLIVTIFIAFTNFDLYHQAPANLFTWTGLETFSKLFNLNGDIGSTFVTIFIWTMIWAVASTASNYIFGMILALLINKKSIKGKKIFRTFFVVTIAVPQFVSLLIMSKILADTGILNVMLQNWGIIDKPLPFLSDGTWAKCTIIVVNMWVGIPYTMLITTGILMNIPADLYESAKLDGANVFRMFLNITLPYMLFVTSPYLITQFIGNVNNFNVIYFLTGGTPLKAGMYQAGETDLLVTWLYKLTVNDTKDYNLGAAIGIIVFVISAVFSLIVYNQTGSVKREEEFQ